MTRLLLATANPGKVREIEALLRGQPVRLETLADHPELGPTEETGATFEENARLKAEHAARISGLWALAEDSGLVVDALGGAPGVHSARWAGAHGNDAANNRRLARQLAGVPPEKRTARYVCALALAGPDGRVIATHAASCEGRIAEAPRGDGGFGYDPYFVPEGEKRTMAEHAPGEKDAISHRGKAVRGFLPVLLHHLGLGALP